MTTAHFISIEEADALLADVSVTIRSQNLPLVDALGKRLADDLYAPVDVPGFDNSAMDGYALRWEDTATYECLEVIGEMAAGSDHELKIGAGQACRIFTGAPMPQGTDTVIMQEHVEKLEGSIRLLEKPKETGQHVRKQGSQNKKGQVVMERGTLLKSGSIGFLAGLGFAVIPVFIGPRVGVLVTGNELVAPGQALKKGQIYESNSYALRAALEELGIRPAFSRRVPDDRDQTFEQVKEAISTCDVLLISGGISVGDYDYVSAALQKARVIPLFYKVRQRPGKPLFIGKLGDKVVAGLPGNPASVLTCFFRHIRPYLYRCMGADASEVAPESLPLAEAFSKVGGLTFLMKGHKQDGKVKALAGQESFRMDAFVKANCLIEFPENEKHIAAGSLVKTYPLD